MNAGLLVVGSDLLAGQESVVERFALRGVFVLAVTEVTPRALLAALRMHALDPAQTWLVARDPATAGAAETAGLTGVVVIGAGEDRDGTILVRHARDLSDAPRVLVRRGGGCWHGS